MYVFNRGDKGLNLDLGVIDLHLKILPAWEGSTFEGGTCKLNISDWWITHSVFIPPSLRPQ